MPLKTDYKSLYIGGSWVKPQGKEVYTVINPATEKAIGEVPVGTAADADAAITAARGSVRPRPLAEDGVARSRRDSAKIS